ncbi:hypothetical protein P7C71_g420, partial [Lecanoromycetidae sp. Uapishka_2]
MAASSYYDEPTMAQAENTHMEGHDGQSQGLGQEMHSETHSYPQQSYNEQGSGMYGGQQHMGNNSLGQGGSQQMNQQNSHFFGGQQQHEMGNGNNIHGAGQQQMGNSNYAQGAGQQQMNGGVGQAAEVDDRLDRIEKKFGGDRFNNPDNVEKNKALNANILKRIKQVGMMAM